MNTEKDDRSVFRSFSWSVNLLLFLGIGALLLVAERGVGVLGLCRSCSYWGV